MSALFSKMNVSMSVWPFVILRLFWSATSCGGRQVRRPTSERGLVVEHVAVELDLHQLAVVADGQLRLIAAENASVLPLFLIVTLTCLSLTSVLVTARLHGPPPWPGRFGLAGELWTSGKVTSPSRSAEGRVVDRDRVAVHEVPGRAPVRAGEVGELVVHGPAGGGHTMFMSSSSDVVHDDARRPRDAGSRHRRSARASRSPTGCPALAQM